MTLQLTNAKVNGFSTVVNECLRKAYAVQAKSSLRDCLPNLRCLHGSLRHGHTETCLVEFPLYLLFSIQKKHLGCYATLKSAGASLPVVALPRLLRWLLLPGSGTKLGSQ